MASSHFPTGGGTFTGSISGTQVAFGSGADTLAGNAALAWDGTGLSVTGTNASVLNINDLSFTNTDSAVGPHQIYQLYSNATDGGIYQGGWSDGVSPPVLLNGVFISTAAAGVAAVVAVGNGPADSGDGLSQNSIAFAVQDDYAANMISVVELGSGGATGSTGGLGINTDAPAAIVHAVNTNTSPSNPGATTVVGILEGRADQSGDLLQAKLTGGAVLTSISSTGVVKAAGYKSSDGSTGATGSANATNTLTIKNGLVTNIA